MKMVKTLFFDTYALIEINKGNVKYQKYIQETKVLLNNLNILEYVYFLIREKKEGQIEESFDKLAKFNVDYDKELLIKAAKMKYMFKKDKISFVDCIGYQLAKKYNVKFLTGDIKFKNKENVEFVK